MKTFWEKVISMFTGYTESAGPGGYVKPDTKSLPGGAAGGPR